MLKGGEEEIKRSERSKQLLHVFVPSRKTKNAKQRCYLH